VDARAKEVEIIKPVKTEADKVIVSWCPFCPEVFECKDELLRHKNRIHLGIPPKECGFCVQETNVYGSLENQFYHDNDLLNHVVKKHKNRLKTLKAQQDSGIFICPRCDRGFRKKLAFRVHILEEHEDDGPITCKNLASGCKARFWTKKGVGLHRCQHKATIKIRVISDAKCDEDDAASAAAGFDELLEEEDVTASGQPETAEVCDKNINVKEYSAKLEYCPSSEEQEFDAKHAHFLTNFKSFKADSYECCECGSQFDSSDALGTHLDIHEWVEKGAPSSEDPVNQCLLCEFRPMGYPGPKGEVEKYRQMADHVITEHFNAVLPGVTKPKSAPPRRCHKSNDDKPLTMMKIDDNEDIMEVVDSSKLRTQCTVCYKDFESALQLRIHIKYAHQRNTETAKQLEVLNTCWKCHKTCTSESQLSLHLSLYCDVSYACDFCPSTFNQIKVLAVHVKAVHKGETVFVESSQQNQRDPIDKAPVMVRCPYRTTDFCDRTFTDTNSREYANHISQHHIDQMKKHVDKTRIRQDDSERRQALKRKAQDDIEDEIEEVVVPPAKSQPLSTNNPFMADEIDGEQEENERSENETLSKFEDVDVPCIFCGKEIPNPGKPGLYPIIGHLRALHDKETNWECNKCDYFSDKMDKFFQHYKKHL